MGGDFRVGLTCDCLSPTGELVYKDIGLGLLEAAGVDYTFLRDGADEVRPDQIRDLDALICLGPRVTEESLAGSARLAVVARFGVGYDSVDVEACTRADVMLTITKGSVDNAVAESIVCLMQALAKRLFLKDRLTREGRWNEKVHHMGNDVAGKVVGSIGLGGIASRLFELLQPYGLARAMSFDPYARPDHAAALGVELVDWDTLLRESDYVCVNCPLTDETQGMVNADAFDKMKPTAYFINTARGPIMDEDALCEALKTGQIHGAASDVFHEEPTPVDNPLFELDNFIATPHGLAWTDEMFLANGSMACESALAVSRGEVPKHVINTEVLDQPGLKAKLDQYGRGR